MDAEIARALRDVERITEDRLGWLRLSELQARADSVDAALRSAADAVSAAKKAQVRKAGSSWHAAAVAVLLGTRALQKADAALVAASQEPDARGDVFAANLRLAGAAIDAALLHAGVALGSATDAARRTRAGATRGAAQQGAALRRASLVAELSAGPGSASNLAQRNADAMSVSVRHLELLIRRARKHP